MQKQLSPSHQSDRCLGQESSHNLFSNENQTMPESGKGGTNETKN